jgi:hypothetical protein
MFELSSIPEFRVSLSRLLSTGIPLQALRSEPQVKVSIAADILEVRILAIVCMRTKYLVKDGHNCKHTSGAHFRSDLYVPQSY